MSKPKLTIQQDNTKQIMDVIKSFRHDKVLVGIPASDPDRTPEAGEADSGISNAALLFINEFGSPGQNIPPRTPMQTGITLAQEPIADEYKKGLQTSWKKGLPGLDLHYERAGMIAVASVKKVINEQINMEAPKQSTLDGRKRRGFKGTKALLVTGQMRNAITHVVQKGK